LDVVRTPSSKVMTMALLPVCHVDDEVIALRRDNNRSPEISSAGGLVLRREND
jgi:hypothetical protein